MNKSIIKKALLIQRNIEKILDADEVLKGITELKGQTFELNELNQILKNIGTSGFVYAVCGYWETENFNEFGCFVDDNAVFYHIDWIKENDQYTITKVTKRA